jgi:hypothetical protein
MTVLDWLLDGDPAIRWQVKGDLLDAGTDEVAAERARVGTEGWGARLLALQRPDGRWAGEQAFFPLFTSTHFTLLILCELGLEPRSREARRAIGRVRAGDVRFEYDDEPYFEGEVEPCINGTVVSIGSYFGEDVGPIVGRLLGEQMDDGGWNCEQENGSTRGSFDTTIHVLEGLLAYERAIGASAEITAARRRGEAYLLERRLLRRKSTGELIEPRFRYDFPTSRFERLVAPTPRRLYDILRALDYFRAAGLAPDERAREAIEVLVSKRDADGRWPVEFRFPGEYHFEMDDAVGRPSRWNTLRAMRVLRWWEAGTPQTLGRPAEV